MTETPIRMVMEECPRGLRTELNAPIPVAVAGLGGAFGIMFAMLLWILSGQIVYFVSIGSMAIAYIAGYWLAEGVDAGRRSTTVDSWPFLTEAYSHTLNVARWSQPFVVCAAGASAIIAVVGAGPAIIPNLVTLLTCVGVLGVSRMTIRRLESSEQSLLSKDLDGLRNSLRRTDWPLFALFFGPLLATFGPWYAVYSPNSGMEFSLGVFATLALSIPLGLLWGGKAVLGSSAPELVRSVRDDEHSDLEFEKGSIAIKVYADMERKGMLPPDDQDPGLRLYDLVHEVAEKAAMDAGPVSRTMREQAALRAAARAVELWKQTQRKAKERKPTEVSPLAPPPVK